MELPLALLRCYPNLLKRRDGCPPLTTSGMERHMNTEERGPIFERRLRGSVADNEVIRAETEKMLRDGVVEPVNGAWGFPVVLTKKRDGTVRFCVDYRRLNAITVRDVYPLPRIDETVESLGGASWFSTLDLHSGY